MKYTDPDGNFVVTTALVAKVVTGAVIGAVVSAASNMLVQTAANYIKNGGDLKAAIDNVDFKSVGTAALSGAISGAITGGFSEVSSAYKCYKTAKALVNAGANMTGATVSTIVDNVVHEKPANTNLARNNVIAGLAGVGAGLTSTTAAGNVLSDGGKTETVWFNSIDSTGRITEMVTKEPFDIATNNFLKETGIGIGSEVFTNTLDN